MSLHSLANSKGTALNPFGDGEALDEQKLADTVRTLPISMCGFLPVYTMIVAAKAMGASRARLIDYRTSGDVSGDFSQVVGYAGMVIE